MQKLQSCKYTVKRGKGGWAYLKPTNHGRIPLKLIICLSVHRKVWETDAGKKIHIPEGRSRNAKENPMPSKKQVIK